MGEISQELVKFKSSIEGSISTMKTKCDDLSSKVHTANEACKTAKSSFSSNYNSENKTVVMKLFDSIESLYSKVETSVSGNLKSTLNDSETLVNDIKKLEEINTTIANNQSIVNTTDDESKKSSAQNIINEKNNEFKTLHDSALEKYNKLKSMQDDLGEALEDIKTDNPDDIKVEGGVFKKDSYQASNGKVISYYMYVPTVTEGDGKLPMLVYFHGLHETLDKYPDRGLGGLINNKTVEPNGIVILPQADGGTIDKEFCQRDYGEAVIELVKHTAEQYNGDLNRVSVSGHSNGGAAVYHMVNNFPGFFAAAAPISGTGRTDQGVMQTNLFAIWGDRDHAISYNQALGVPIRLQKQGYNASYYVFRGKGHDIQTLAWQEQYQDSAGNQISLIDWLMSKTL